MDYIQIVYISATFYFLSAILNFVGHFRICWESGLSNKKLTLRVQISLLFCLRHIRDTSFSNFIMHSLSIELSPRSWQAGDNRGFDHNETAPRGGVLHTSFISGSPKFHSFLASGAMFSRYCSFKSSQFSNVISMGFFRTLNPRYSHTIVGLLRKATATYSGTLELLRSNFKPI